MATEPKRIGNWTPDGRAERAIARREYRELTPGQRVEQAMTLSYELDKLAARGRARAASGTQLTEGLPLEGEPLLAALQDAEVLITKHGRLDVMQFVSPDLEYADLESAAIEDEVFGHRVRFCGYEHLVAMKEAAGRDQDIIDLEHLRDAREEE